MKPCTHNQKRLALLVLQNLNEDEARELQRHMVTCQGCRSYLEEIKAVSRNLAEIEPLIDLPRSTDFHQRLLSRLEAEKQRTLSAQIRSLCFRFPDSWRAALPVIGASTAAIAVLFLLRPERKADQPATVSVPAVVPAPVATKADSAPMLSTYQFLANHSPDQLDELLTRQGSRNPAPAPVYTPAILPRSELLE